MQKIDTDYKTLSEIDPKVVQFYAEDKRTRTTGYTEDEEPKPIVEEYTVIVLNKPSQVDYEYVKSRKVNRHSDAVVMAALESAITWEEFYFNHDLYLAWVADYAKWEEEQPTEEIINEDSKQEAVIVPAPTLRAIDLAERRAHYKIVELTQDAKYNNNEPGFEELHKDEELTTVRTHYFEPKSAEEIAAIHSTDAFKERYTATYKSLAVTLKDGEEVLFDVGAGKDGVLGIDNIKDLLLAFQYGDPEEPINWIMADNKVVPVMAADLGNALIEFNRRKQLVFAAYSKWRSGNKQNPFTF